MQLYVKENIEPGVEDSNEKIDGKASVRFRFSVSLL